MKYKYKLKEVKIGDIKTDKGIKSTVTSINPSTKSISWDIDYVPAFDSTFKEFDELRKFITKLSRDTKDETIDKIADEVKNSFNKYRTHIRKNYPEQYKKYTMNEVNLSHHMQLGDDWGEIIFYLEKYGTDKEIDAYITAFKEQAGPHFDDSNFDHVKEFQKWVKTAMRADEISTSGGAGAYNTPYAFKLVKKQKEIIPEGIGATLGPGPKAGIDGVIDSAYTKQFKYKLVPKTKDGTYVQKGSGLEVNKLF